MLATSQSEGRKEEKKGSKERLFLKKWGNSLNASVAAGKIDPALLRLSYSVFSKYHIQLPPPRSAVLLHSSNNNKRTEKKGEEGRGDRLLPRKRNRKANDATNSEPVVVDAIAAFCYVSASHRRLLLRRLYVYNK